METLRLIPYFITVLDIGAGCPAPDQLVNKGNNMGYVHRLASGSGDPGRPGATDDKARIGTFNLAIVKLVNVFQEFNLARDPRFSVNESPVVRNLTVGNSGNFCFHRVFGCNDEFHNC